MSALCRFPITYDREIDADIFELIHETPVKRRSERIRQLIRLGLQVEQSGGFVRPIIQEAGTELKQDRQRRRLSFAPEQD